MKDTEDKDMALRGMRHAAVIARERASRFGLRIPVWRDGAIVFVDPKVQPVDADNPYNPPENPKNQLND
mgnify:CR=1 FL=1